MPLRILKLFKTTSEPRDGLTQVEREAVVDVLHYSIYSDNHIALAETELVEGALDSLDWDPAVALTTYEAHSIATVRIAKESPGGHEAFLASVSERLRSPRSRQHALDYAARVIALDGQTPAESTTLAALRAALDRA